ncbi:MAG: molybdenum cofactor guanylyltransferase MobA [Methylotenera sp.]
MIRITGIILAGGQGRRMANADAGASVTKTIEKGLVNFLNQPMIAHVAQRLKPQVNEIIINANTETERYAALGYPVIHDNILGYAGPLAGLHAGMRAAKNPYILSVPCDSPLLAVDLAKRLTSALVKSGADIAVAKTASQVHPVFCLCNKSLLPHLENYLQNGGRKFDAWYGSLNVIEVPFDDNPLAFANVNTPEDLIKLEASV